MRCQLSCVTINTLLLLLSTALLPIESAAQDLKYGGMCNASAAVALDTNRFIVADDEYNVLQIYDKKERARPFQTVTLSKVFAGEILDGDDQETDLEGAAILGEKIFWIGSHSTSKKGKHRPARHRLFAITARPGSDGKYIIERAGNIYTTLVTDLENDNRFAKYKIKEAKNIKPKDVGGLSIEGLAATPEGTLLIGFRNPLRGGKVKNSKLVGGMALVVPLLNPLEVIDGKQAKFGVPIELDLAGYGIRSMESQKKSYLIVAGPYHENIEMPGHKREESRLYLWSEKTVSPLPIRLSDLNVETAFFYPADDRFVQLLSDDGQPNCNDSFRSRRQRLGKR